jgi:polyhydroxyalkanoate synthesis regulator protein
MAPGFVSLPGKRSARPMASAPVLIKRYARSRLYDAARGRYVTLAELRLWRRKRVAFVVQDAETGEDVTRALFA